MTDLPTAEPRPFSVDFDVEGYVQRRSGEVRPRGTFPIEPCDETIEQYVSAELRRLAARTIIHPGGASTHAAFIPGGCYGDVWDWDAFFAGAGTDPDHRDAWFGSLRLFLDAIRDDGQPAATISREGLPQYESTALPLQAQWAVLISRRLGDFDWLEPYWPRLLACRAWYRQRCGGRHGLYRLVHRHGMGIDNDPALYLRANGHVAPVHVNVFHWREHRAMAQIARRLGHAGDAERFAAEAQAMAEAIEAYMYDPIDGLHYHLDLADHGPLPRQGPTWELHYKIRSCACLLPLWAGLTSPDRARRIIEQHVLNDEEFLSPFGIRSLAKNERMYNNTLMGNPSNWQGPIWGLSTALTAQGLARYGWREQASDVARRFMAVLAGDLRTNGTTHECYNAETGEPVMKPDFASFNLLACDLARNVREGVDPLALEDAEA